MQVEHKNNPVKSLTVRLRRSYEWMTCVVLVLAGVLGLGAAIIPSSSLNTTSVACAIVSLLAMAVGLERVTLISGLQESLLRLSEDRINLLEKQEELRNLLVAVVEKNPDVIFNEVSRGLKDPFLFAIFTRLFRDKMARILSSLRSGEIYIDDKDTFTLFYIEALNHYASPDSNFLATSLPSSLYFWNEKTQRAVADFTKKGGKMTRIFLVREGDLENDEVKNILEDQASADIKVHLAEYDEVPRELRSTFLMIDQGLRIAWEVRVDVFGNIHDVSVTANRDRIKHYQTQLQKLSVRHFERAGVAYGSG